MDLVLSTAVNPERIRRSQICDVGGQINPRPGLDDVESIFVNTG